MERLKRNEPETLKYNKNYNRYNKHYEYTITKYHNFVII